MLWLTAYGRILLAKLGAVALLLAVAIHNKWRTTPRLAADARAVQELRRAIGVEYILFATVLALTAALGQVEPPRVRIARDTAAIAGGAADFQRKPRAGKLPDHAVGQSSARRPQRVGGRGRGSERAASRAAGGRVRAVAAGGRDRAAAPQGGTRCGGTLPPSWQRAFARRDLARRGARADRRFHQDGLRRSTCRSDDAPMTNAR